MNKLIQILIFNISFVGIYFAQPLNLFDFSSLERVKTEYKSNNSFNNEIDALKKLSKVAVEEAPFTITKYTAPSVDGASTNDYYSDSPYWWPVEDDPTAPYFRKDGERNPDRFMDHKEELAKFYKGIMSIAYYSYLSGDNQYAKNANDLLKIWFINPKTKMNPNLKYSQLIRNRDRKRGVGIIDGRRLAVLTEGISLLNEMGKLDTSVFTGIKNWYSDYLEWLTQSYYGIDEKNRGNNHGTWWSFQVAIISSFVQNNAEIEMLNTHTKHFLLDNQIDEDGHQPMEEARTKSLSYCSFNLTAHSLLSTVLAKHNIDNWNYVNKNETTIIGAMDYLIPFIEHPNNWSHKQISTFNNSDALFLGLAGLQLNNREYLRLYNKLSKNYLGRINKPTYDPIQIIINVVVKTKLEENEK